MNLSPAGAMELIGHEAIVPMRYRDAGGNWTLGVGHTKWAGAPDPATFTGIMSIADVIELFRADVKRYADQVAAALKVAVTQTQFDALVSYHYNTGDIAHSAITAAVNAGDTPRAIAAFDLYHSPPAVIGRRAAEKALFATGQYSHGGFATILQASPTGSIDWGSAKRVDLRPLFAAQPVA